MSSPVAWKFFGRTSEGLVCQLCEDIAEKGGDESKRTVLSDLGCTTNMISHLRVHHPDDLRAAEALIPKQTTLRPFISTPTLQAPTVNFTPEQQCRGNELMADWIVEDIKTASTDRGFKIFSLSSLQLSNQHAVDTMEMCCADHPKI